MKHQNIIAHDPEALGHGSQDFGARRGVDSQASHRQRLVLYDGEADPSRAGAIESILERRGFRYDPDTRSHRVMSLESERILEAKS